MLELTNPKNLPLRIPRMSCPLNKVDCDKSHKDIVIVQRNEKGEYLLRDYSMHSDAFAEAWFSEQQILKFITNESKRYQSIRQNIHLKDPVYFREFPVQLKYTKGEIERLRVEAKNKRIKLVDLIREKSLV